jgi:Ca-activated chloride channel family protein
MNWDNPTILLGLWILPLLAWLLVHAHRKRAAAGRRFIEPVMVRRLMPAVGGARPWLKGTAVILGVGCVIFAGARPRFGVYYENVTARGVDLLVLLDVSRSMLAEDVAPNRLERAKSDIRDLLKKLAGDRVGLVVFAGKPVLKVPLTTDQGFFQIVLDEVDPRSAPRGGTMIGDGIRMCMQSMPPRMDRDQVIVLITDGDDQDSMPKEAAEQAAKRGIRIFTVGLGDEREGARVPLREGGKSVGYLKYEGKEQWLQLKPDLLKQIALTTGGAYIPAGTRAYDLGEIYEEHLAGLARGEDAVSENRKRYREQFQLFLCLGIAMLLGSALVPEYPAQRKSPRAGLQEAGR